MSSLSIQVEKPRAHHVVITEDSLVVELADGRTISAPLAWYPRLLHGRAKERKNWRLIGAGEGIHWPDLDEDLSVQSLIAGSPSGENGDSFKRWLKGRKSRVHRVRSSTRSASGKGSRKKPLAAHRS
jgi:hypothetical protein